MADSGVPKPHPGGDRMPDEPEAPSSRAEAQHWLEMYRQIVDFEEGMLARMREIQRDLPVEVQAEVQNSNIAPMAELISTYRDRIKRFERALITLAPEEES